MACGDRRRPWLRRWRWRLRGWLRLRRVALCLAAAALLAVVLDLPAEHRDYVAARLLLDAVPHPPFHLPATAANRPVTRTIQLELGHATARCGGCLVVVLGVDPEDLLEVTAADEQQPVKALGADGPHPPLRAGVGVGVGRLHGCGQHLGGLLVQARPPGGGGSPWGGVQAVAAQRGADRGRRDAHAKLLKFALDALVAPMGVLAGQADDQLLRFLVGWWSPWPAVRVGPGAGDQPPAPAQQRVGVDEEARQRARGSARLSAASRARSAGWSLGRAICRSSTASWWRSTRISRSWRPCCGPAGRAAGWSGRVSGGRASTARR